MFVSGNTLYYVTDDDPTSTACTVDEISQISVYTDYNPSTAVVPNLSDKGITITYDETNGTKSNPLTYTDHVTSAISFSEPGINLIDLDYKSRLSNYYHEISYTVAGNVDTIQVWENNTKTTKLFTKALTYDSTSGNLTQIVVTDNVNSSTLTKAFTYDVDGNLETITRTYA